MLNRNKLKFFKLLLALCSVMLFIGKVHAENTNDNLRHFLFIGEPSADGWAYAMKNPEDRKAVVQKGFQAIGGDIVSYYWGLGDGKNYITVTIPNNNELIQAVYLMRLPSGILTSYKIIELMPSDQMSKALQRSKKLIDKDTTTK